MNLNNILQKVNLEKSLYITEKGAEKSENINNIDHRINLWKKYINVKSDFEFDQCIRYLSNINLTSFKKLAYDQVIENSFNSEGWVQIYKELININFDKLHITENYDLKYIFKDISFERFFERFIEVAYKVLDKELFEFKITIPEELWNDLLRSLVLDLYQISKRTLILEINAARLENTLQGNTASERYQYFGEQFLTNDTYIAGLYEEYPILLRSICNTIYQWKNSVTEIITRLSNDQEILSARFFSDKCIGSLKRIQINKGDKHNNGRSVAILEFDSGFKIVYKPKSLKIDVEFNKLLDSLNKQLVLKNKLYITKVENKGTYGWAEFITYKGCHNEQEISNFYERMGFLLGLLNSINAVDFHYENLIAHGEHPVLIDLESLFHQTLTQPKSLERAYNRAKKVIDNSVKSTGIVPFLTFYSEKDGQGVGIDLSGLNGESEQSYPYKVPTISNQNQDDMQVSFKHITIKKEITNIPTLNEKHINIKDYLEAIKDGFNNFYYFVLNNKNQFKKMIEDFTDVEIRIILRPTALYAELLRLSYHPDFLRDGIDRDILLHRLWSITPQSSIVKRITPYEKKDMLNGNIPYFTTKTNETHLYHNTTEAIDNFFSKSALDLVLEKIDAMDERDCQEQLQVLHMSIVASTAKYNADSTHIKIDYNYTNPIQNKNDFLEAACKIGDYLLSRAIPGVNKEEEEYCWISTVLFEKDEVEWEISPIWNDLYNGVTGIALFFGYLSKISKLSKYKNAARKAIAPARQQLKELKNQENFPIGAFTGVGGIIYTINHLATLWNDKSLKKEVYDTIPFLTNAIKHDTTYDVIDGAAGILNVLIGIYKETGDESILEIAQKCADHLVNNATTIDNGVGWKNEWREVPHIGYGHGVAGIIASLAQLYKINKSENLKIIIEQGLNYERQFFNSEQNNWFIPTKEDYRPVAWCHGAPGILLSRLILVDSGYKDNVIEKEIEIALDTTLKLGFGNNHTICHGDFGQIDILSYASKVLKDNSLITLNNNVSYQVLQLIKNKGLEQGYSRGVESYGLMSGLSGYGYGMLKQHSPEIVPSILRLENCLS